MVDAPVPKKGGRGGAGQSADGEGYPGGGADVGERWRRDFSLTQRVEEHRPEYQEREHGCARENGVGGDDDGAVGLHELLAEQDPGERDTQR